MPLCPRPYLEWVTLGMLVADHDLGALWAIPPNVGVMPADPKKYGKKEFMVVKVALAPPVPSRAEVWELARKVFAKILNAGLLQGLLGLEVAYNVWEGGSSGKTVLSVCTETSRIRHLLTLSVDDLRTYNRPEGVMCTWDEDVEKRVRGEQVT